MEWVRLGDIAEISAGKAAPKSNELSDEGLPFIRAGFLEDLLSCDDEPSFPSVSSEVAQRLKYKIYEPGTIIFAKSGMSIMKDRVVMLKRCSYLVSHLAAVIVNEDRANKNFIKYQLMYKKPSSLIQGDSYPSISITNISEWEVFLPEMKIQEMAASVLIICENLIAKRQEQIEALDDLVESVFYEMFETYIEGGTEKFRLSEITSHISSGSTPKGGKEVYQSEGVPLIRSQDVMMNYLDYSKVVYISEEIHKSMKRSTLQYKDVLLNITGASIGRTAIFYGESGSANSNQHVASIRLKDNTITPEFLSYYLSTDFFQKIIKKISSGGTREALNFKQIGEFGIPKVPMELQIKFTKIKENIVIEKEKLKASLEALEILFDALMQEAFSGNLV